MNFGTPQEMIDEENNYNESLNMNKQTIAVWFSCGAASAVAAKLIVEKYKETHNILIVNNPVKEEHEDNRRFLKDVEKWMGIPIIEALNSEYPNASIVEVFDKRKYISGVSGAPCTQQLKKEARYQFEKLYKIDWHVLGFTLDEKSRHERFTKYERDNVIPILIDENITKNDCFKILNDAGIKLPFIYSLGYPNANCIGCVKSSSPQYWNLVRETFPAVFEQRAEQSKRIGCKLVKIHLKYIPWAVKRGLLYYDKDTDKQLSVINKKGKIVHSIRFGLDDLPDHLKGGKIKSYECGIFCDTK